MYVPGDVPSENKMHLGEKPNFKNLTLKGLSHEIDFKNYNQTLKNLT